MRELSDKERDFLKSSRKERTGDDTPGSGRTRLNAILSEKRKLRIWGRVHVVLLTLGAVIPLLAITAGAMISAQFGDLIESPIFKSFSEDEALKRLVGFDVLESSGWLQGLIWWEHNYWWILLVAWGAFFLLAVGIIIAEGRRKLKLDALEEEREKAEEDNS